MNRKGLWSLRIFAGLFFLTLCAELLANDRPLLIFYQSGWLLPVAVDYPETRFGGDFLTPADYRDPYVRELITQDGWMLWPPIPYRYNTHITDLDKPVPSPPSHRNWLGTDDQARDVLARLIYGTRISILFGLTLTVFIALISVAVGLIQGYYGGWIDLFGQRVIEIWDAIPQLYILLIFAALIRPNFFTLLLIMLAFGWNALSGLVRAEVLKVRNYDYVTAARALGVSDTRIMLRHVLPNALVTTLTFLPFIASGALVTLTALDFLGFGLPAGSASLGEMLAQGKNNLHAPWLGITGFFITALILTLMIFIGEAWRAALSPYQQR